MKFKYSLKKLLLVISIITVASVVLLPNLIFAINQVVDGFRLDKNISQLRVDAHGVCWNTQNTSGSEDYFIPTNTASEWSQFISNKPGAVNLSICGSVINCVGSFVNTGAPYYSCSGLGGGASCPDGGFPGNASSLACVGVGGGSGCGAFSGQIYNTLYYPAIYTISVPAQNGGTACPFAAGTVGYNRTVSAQQGGSFLSGTRISMSGYSYKSIELIRVGDVVKGFNGFNSVVQLKPRLHKGNVYGINGKKVFATGSHPFRTTMGWKSFDEKMGNDLHPELNIRTLEVGDVLLREDGQRELIKSINYEYKEVQVYNFEVTGERDYFADGYSVHNK